MDPLTTAMSDISFPAASVSSGLIQDFMRHSSSGLGAMYDFGASKKERAGDSDSLRKLACAAVSSVSITSACEVLESVARSNFALATPEVLLGDDEKRVSRAWFWTGLRGTNSSSFWRSLTPLLLLLLPRHRLVSSS